MSQTLNEKLITACINRDSKAIGQLVSEGADPNLMTDGQYPLYYAVSLGDAEAVTILLKHGAEFLQLYVTVALSHYDSNVIQAFTDCGVSINFNNNFGATSLLTACRTGDAKITDLLLKYGADPNCVDEFEYAPLHIAAMYGKSAICSLLIKYGANVNQEDAEGNCPLHMAAAKGNTEICKILLDEKADINAQNFNRQLPIEVAYERDYYECAEYLCERGAEVSPNNRMCMDYILERIARKRAANV